MSCKDVRNNAEHRYTIKYKPSMLIYQTLKIKVEGSGSACGWRVSPVSRTALLKMAAD